MELLRINTPGNLRCLREMVALALMLVAAIPCEVVKECHRIFE